MFFLKIECYLYVLKMVVSRCCLLYSLKYAVLVNFICDLKLVLFYRRDHPILNLVVSSCAWQLAVLELHEINEVNRELQQHMDPPTLTDGLP